MDHILIIVIKIIQVGIIIHLILIIQRRCLHQSPTLRHHQIQAQIPNLNPHLTPHQLFHHHRSLPRWIF